MLNYYIDHSFEKEKEVLTVSGHIPNSFSGMKDYISLLESNTSCDSYTILGPDSQCMLCISWK